MSLSTKKFRGGTAHIRPRANIIRMLGDELISSDTVAMTELVKNAYDADATEVLIRFRGDIQASDGYIEVIDNGTGMSLETILSAWLEPATSHKRDRRVSNRGRRMLGEKGIGRFASARLSRQLELITREERAQREIVVGLNWDSFGRSEYLDEVECSWEERAPVRLTSGHGTVLRLIGTNSVWDSASLQFLRGELSRLISPFDYIQDFRIVLDLPSDFQDISGPIQPSRLLSSPHYEIKGDISAHGAYSFEYAEHGGDSENFVGDFGKSRTYECGPFEIELRVWDREREAIGTLSDIFGINPTEARRELNNSSGFYIYRDGFRVLPYGDNNNDWLRLDLRRVQNPTLRVSNNQVVGCVIISADRNPSLKDQTNREGIVASRGFDDLRELIINSLAQLEQRRYRYRRAKTPPAKHPQGGIFSGFNLGPVRSAVRERYPNDSNLINAVDVQERELSARIREVQEVLSRYRRLGTLGKLVDRFLHDGKMPLSQINSEAYLQIQNIGEYGLTPSVADPIEDGFEYILKRGEILAWNFQKIEPFGGRTRGRPSRNSLESIIASAFDLHESKIQELGVVCDLPTLETIVTVDPVEIQEAVFNLLDNSLYWLEHGTAEGERRIEVEVERTPSGEVEILYSDSGPGVPEDQVDYIFDPYFSLKPGEPDWGCQLSGRLSLNTMGTWNW